LRGTPEPVYVGPPSAGRDGRQPSRSRRLRPRSANVLDFLFIKGVGFGLVLSAPAGPVGVLCVQRTLTEGRWHGLISGLAAAVADAIYGAIAAFGVSAVSGWIVEHQLSLRFVGGVLLIVLGARALYKEPMPVTQRVRERIHTRGLVEDAVSAFFLTLSNPITLFSFLTVFAALGATEAGESVDKAALLVAGVFCGAAIWWVSLSLGAHYVRDWLDHGFQQWVNRVLAVVLLAVGVGALASIVFGFGLNGT